MNSVELEEWHELIDERDKLQVRITELEQDKDELKIQIRGQRESAKAHAEYCEKLQARVQRLETALRSAEILNREAINGYSRGFKIAAEVDVQEANRIIREALEQEGEK